MGLLGRSASRELLVGEKGNEADGNSADDAEDDHNANLLGRPVLTLGKLVEGVASDKSVADGRHFGYLGD